MGESRLYTEIPLALSHGGTRLFRMNAGMAWAGTVVERTGRRLVLIDYPPVRLGPPGLSDLIGFSAPGCVFTAIEAKSAKGQASLLQDTFIETVLRCGGRAGIARSVEDARKIIGG